MIPNQTDQKNNQPPSRYTNRVTTLFDICMIFFFNTWAVFCVLFPSSVFFSRITIKKQRQFNKVKWIWNFFLLIFHSIHGDVQSSIFLIVSLQLHILHRLLCCCCYFWDYFLIDCFLHITQFFDYIKRTLYPSLLSLSDSIRRQMNRLFLWFFLFFIYFLESIDKSFCFKWRDHNF